MNLYLRRFSVADNKIVHYFPPLPPKREKRVGIYCRVSTNSADQLKSLTAQVSALTRLTAVNPKWLLVDVYIDIASSKTGSSRKEFSRMLQDCKSRDKKKEFEERLKEYNATQTFPVMHVNTLFERIVEAIQDVIDDRDYEMQEVLDDYLNYCYNDKLIIVSDSWKRMRVQLAGTTFGFNVKENLYYDNIDRGFSAHDYLGLYKEKSVKAVGKITAIVTAVNVGTDLEYKVELGELTDERKLQIERAIEDGKNYGYVLDAIRYFFVDKFYETDFKKVTPRAPMGSRVFDLTQILEIEKLPETQDIAELLKTKTWG